MSSTPTLLDASAVLALLGNEKGSDRVRELGRGSFISAVNLAEVIQKLTDRGVPIAAARAAVAGLQFQVVPFSAEEAYHTADFVRKGISLGDRACLATAQMHGYRVVTADSAWVPIRRSVEVVLFRRRS